VLFAVVSCKKKNSTPEARREGIKLRKFCRFLVFSGLVVEGFFRCTLTCLRMKQAVMAAIPGVKEDDPRVLFELGEKIGKGSRKKQEVNEKECLTFVLFRCLRFCFQGSQQNYIPDCSYQVYQR
jgi:hypothetical protein